MENKRRFSIQAAAALLQNAHLKGFFTGRIWQGASKGVCVPGLNCYSCPGAVGACPIGSLQSFLAARPIKLPYYVVGLLIFFGALLGRAVCGFLCPFGFLQELLHKIPFPKKLRGFRGERALRRLKYLILVLLVVLPLFFALTPFFCKYLCPAGTLAGVLLALADAAVRPLLGGLFAWKAAVLLALVVLSLMIWRPFCKYLCPLGAFYALFQKVSILRLALDKEKCVSCGKCEKACPMDVKVTCDPNSTECIRCGACVHACPAGALRFCGGKGKPGKRMADNHE